MPFADKSFSCVLCSQVIQHVPKDSSILSELIRVLKPGGRLVLGTPDYANWQWVVTEKAYRVFARGAYADEHIAHYTRDELLQHFSALGFTHEAHADCEILRGELIMALRKQQHHEELRAPDIGRRPACEEKHAAEQHQVLNGKDGLVAVQPTDRRSRPPPGGTR